MDQHGRPSLKGTIMTVMDYRTEDGRADYGFSLEFHPGVGWRVYIIFQPFRQDGDGSLRLAYEATDRNGRRYVNWSAKLNSPGEAKTVAALWAELIHREERDQEQRRDNNKKANDPRAARQLRPDAA
jgi:hypothetical protein